MRWTIKRKLYLGFGLAAALTVGFAGIAHWAQMSAQKTQNEIEKTAGTLIDIEHLISYICEVSSEQRAYLISGNDAAIAAIPAQRLDAKATAAHIEASITENEVQKTHFAQYQQYVQQRIVFVNKLNAARKNQGFEAAKTLFETGEDNRLLASILGEFDAMRATARAELDAQETANRKLQQQIAWAELAGILLALAFLIVIAITLTRSINTNVRISVDMLEAMAQKDLSEADGCPVSDDELAVAIQAINRLKQSMSEALGDVSKSAAQVAAAGSEIESTAAEIANTTKAQESDVAQFASSIAEMNATVKDVAEHAERASSAAIDAVSSATQGCAVVDQTRQAMNRISDTVKTASGDITKLGEVTKSIGEVVRIIQEIAEQTNLLALNAAIEAARAGEQGKGFAVVAQEVRVLAERTGKFTKEIADKIQSVQQGAERAVQSMQQGEQVVNEGVSQFNEVSTSLDTITKRVEAAQQGIAMIATATTQQSAATAGLTENIHHIASQVSQTAQQLSQTAMATAELAKLASVMQQVVDGFKLPVAEQVQSNYRQ